jgi:hypothetical protein
MMIIARQLGTPRGRRDEHSSKFFPQLETKVYRSGEERQTTEGDAYKPRDSSGQFIGCLIQALLCEQQCGTCTKQSTLFPTCDEVVNLTGLLETKGMSVSSGKQ